MQGAEGAEILDIARICESQPSLLLHDGSSQDSVVGLLIAMQPACGDLPSACFPTMQEGWCFGLASSGEAEWHTGLRQLAEYRQQYGDAHVGFRSADDKELIKFVKMQRAAYRAGTLPQERYACNLAGKSRQEAKVHAVLPDSFI